MNMSPKDIKRVRQILKDQGAEKVRFTKDGEIHAYGVMKNTNQVGWFFVAYVDVLEKQGINNYFQIED
jgi:hypothetical protein